MTLIYVISIIAACIVSSALSIAIAALFFRFERRYGRRRSVSQYETGKVLTSSVETAAAVRSLEEVEEENTPAANQTEIEMRDKNQHATTPVVLSETALMVYEDSDKSAPNDSSIKLVRRDLENKLDFGIKQSANGEFYITDLSIADSLKDQVKEGDEIVSCEIEMKGFPIQLATAVIQSTITNMSRLKLRNCKNRRPLTIPVITVTDVETGGASGAGIVQASVASTSSRSSSRSSSTSRGSRRSNNASRNRHASPRK